MERQKGGLQRRSRSRIARKRFVSGLTNPWLGLWRPFACSKTGYGKTRNEVLKIVEAAMQKKGREGKASVQTASVVSGAMLTA